ncbi:MAG: LysR family transcriptional regulator [Emcibacteraceae bacterium]|nr:LysR family transcriptional regulator [Emcibacteraceae bacterium]
MDTKQLKTFRTLAKNLSFSKTAEELNFAQSTISAQIRSLENELRLNLFDRLGKKVILTQEGRSVLEYANRFMTIEEEFIENLKTKDIISGELNVYAPNTICVYLLPAILNKFRKNYPDVNFKLQAHLGTKRAIEELKSGNIDLMIVMEEEFKDDDLNITPHRYEEITFICNNDHEHGKNVIDFDALVQENFITTEPTCGYRAVLAKTLLDLGHKLAPIMWFDNAEAIKECVKNNMGISFLPKMAVVADIENNKIKPIHVNKKFNSQIKIQSITHKDKWIGPALNAFQKTINSEF